MSRIPTSTLGGASQPLVEEIVFKGEGLAELDQKLREVNEKLERSGALASTLSNRFDATAATARDWATAPAMTALRTGQRPPFVAQPIVPRQPVAPITTRSATRNEWDLPEPSGPNSLTRIFQGDMNSHQLEQMRAEDEKIKRQMARVQEQEARLKESEERARSPSRLTGQARQGVANMDQALGESITDLGKLRRELKDGTFKAAARDAELYRRAMENVRKEQQRLTNEAQRQALQARYGDRMGDFAHRMTRALPYTNAMSGAAVSGLQWASQHADRGFMGTVEQQRLMAQQLRLDRQLAAAKKGPMEVKTRLYGMGADAMSNLSPAAQDTLGWGMTAAELMPERLQQVLGYGGAAVGTLGMRGAAGLARGAFNAGGNMVGRGAMGLARLGGGGLAGLGVGTLGLGALALGGTAFFSKYNRESMEKHVAAREGGDMTGLDTNSEEYKQFLRIENQDKRIAAIMGARTSNTREQGKRQDSRGWWSNYWGSVTGSTTDEEKQFADKDAVLRSMLAKARAGTDVGDVQAVKASDKAAALDAEKKLARNQVTLAGGGFESLDESYFRTENAFTANIGAQQISDKGSENNAALTKAITELVDFLKNPVKAAEGIISTLTRPFG